MLMAAACGLGLRLQSSRAWLVAPGQPAHATHFLNALAAGLADVVLLNKQAFDVMLATAAARLHVVSCPAAGRPQGWQQQWQGRRH